MAVPSAIKTHTRFPVWKILLLCSVLALAGCEVLLIGGAAVATYEMVKDDRNPSEVASDTSIVTTIKQKLLRDKAVAGWDINVDSFRGEVTLHGNVPDVYTKERAILLASSAKGVVKIINKMVIVPPAN